MPSNGQEQPHISIDTLESGDEIQGRVVKLGKIGAIFDVGGYPGLLHISELRGPGAPQLTEGQVVTLWVTSVDRDRKRLLLTRQKPPEHPIASLQEGTILKGKVVRLTKFGAFVDIGAEKDGLIHISELSSSRISSPSEVVAVGDEVEVKVLSKDLEKGQISLSLKAAAPEPAEPEAETDTPVLTPMQYAWQMACENQERRSRRSKKRRKERERGMPKGEERDDLFMRTLRYRR